MVAIGIGLIAVGYWIAWAGTTQSSLYDAWRCQAGGRGPGGQTGGQVGAPTDCNPRQGDIKAGPFIWRPQSPNLPGPLGILNGPLAGANGVLVGPCL